MIGIQRTNLGQLRHTASLVDILRNALSAISTRLSPQRILLRKNIFLVLALRIFVGQLELFCDVIIMDRGHNRLDHPEVCVHPVGVVLVPARHYLT